VTRAAARAAAVAAVVRVRAEAARAGAAGRAAAVVAVAMVKAVAVRVAVGGMGAVERPEAGWEAEGCIRRPAWGAGAVAKGAGGMAKSSEEGGLVAVGRGWAAETEVAVEGHKVVAPSEAALRRLDAEAAGGKAGAAR